MTVSSRILKTDFLAKNRQTNIDQIPTNFSLTDEQIDNPISPGRELLYSNDAFQRFIEENQQ